MKFLIKKGQKNAKYTPKDNHILENMDVEVIYFGDKIEEFNVTVDNLGYIDGTRINWGLEIIF